MKVFFSYFKSIEFSYTYIKIIIIFFMIKMMICKYKDVNTGKELVANLDMTSAQETSGPSADDFTIE